MEKVLFVRNLLRFLVTIPVVAVVNNMLKYTIGELKLRMRKNLSLHLYDRYLKDSTHYRISNLDTRITNVDHRLIADVEKFCDSLTECYSNISKPLLDIVIFTLQLSNSINIIPPVMIVAYMILSAILLTNLRKPIAGSTVTEQTLEGKFRYVNARIATYAEEIAFYNGNVQEKTTLIAAFNNLISNGRKFLRLNVIIQFFEKIIGQDCASVVGWLSFAFTLINNYDFGKLSIPQRSKLYYTSGKMLYKLSEAVGRLVLSGRGLTRLASYTVRVTELQQVLNDISNNNYKRNTTERSNTFCGNKGTLIIQDNLIEFNKVPIITPNGDVLIKELTVKICSGTNVLVYGPNGSGKSSIFRILGELWPLRGGELTKPQSGKLFYIPQKPYMTMGNLSDQITYPQSTDEAKSNGCTEELLKRYLNLVQLQYMLEREEGLYTVADWRDILSEGEKQRIAMARLFYHAPQFAILDECTSAVAIDVENALYSYCRKMSITLLTVSHRRSLWKHHEYVLYLDGSGGYRFNAISEELELGGS